MKRSVSNLKENRSNNVSTRSLTKSQSKSPNRTIMGVKLYNFSQIQSYGKISRPFLNDLKKNHIKNRLDLQKSTETRVKNRVKKNKLFVPYDYNPFLPEENVKHSKSHFIIETSREDRPDRSKQDCNRNLIDEINNLKNKKINRQKYSRQLINNQQNAQNLSNLVQVQCSNQTNSYKMLPTLKNKLNTKSAIITPIKDQYLQTNEVMEFQDIVNMQQTKYQRVLQESFNIFQILFNKSKLFYQNNQLDKYNFSFNSMIQKFQKTKVSVYRDLSRQARSQVNKKPQKLSQTFDSFNAADLNFNDLLNVAAGRYTPEFIFNMMNIERQHQKSDASQLDPNDINYKQTTQNKLFLCQEGNQSHKQIEEYIKLSLKPQEERYLKVNQRRKKQIEYYLNQEVSLLDYSIYDRKMHNNIKQKINDQLNYFIDADYNYPTDALQRNKLTRLNKEGKDKNMVIKLKKLCQAFEMKKQQQSKVEELIKKK